jgi:hypothetical protein
VQAYEYLEMTTTTDIPMLDKDPWRVAEAVRRAEEALEELTALGLSVDVLLSNRIVIQPGQALAKQDGTLLEGERALAYLNNPEVADCILVLGSQHIRASSGAYGFLRPRSRWTPSYNACLYNYLQCTWLAGVLSSELASSMTWRRRPQGIQ